MRDLTVLAVPAYFGSMGAEYLYLRNKSDNGSRPTIGSRDVSAGLYERQDTIASLTMGVGSLVMPLVMPKLLKPFTPGRGKYGRALVLTAAGAAAATTIADAIARRSSAAAAAAPATASAASGSPASPAGEPAAQPNPETPDRVPGPQDAASARRAALARKVASVTGPATVVAGGIALTTAWGDRTSVKRLWKRRVVKDLGTGPLALAGAVAGWDFIYYWNHRFMHEVRGLWAVHVVHHSSERYNLSTALRQPVADAFGAYVPYGLLAFLGIRPELIETARGVNLLYQFWIHTEAVDSLGPAEEALNTPSHHRVHHGSNGPYLDRNHGSILIVWDRLFGTFEREDEPVRFGLTKNINTFNPWTIATHEHAEMLKDVARSTNWKDRLSFVLRGPGWAAQRRRELDAEDAATDGGVGPGGDAAPRGSGAQVPTATVEAAAASEAAIAPAAKDTATSVG